LRKLLLLTTKKLEKHPTRREREEHKERTNLQSRNNTQKAKGGKDTHPNPNP
jgi:hypothetical protein